MVRDLNKITITYDFKKEIDLPLTPHRIELRPDSYGNIAATDCIEEQVVPTLDKLPVPKVRRRLKNVFNEENRGQCKKVKISEYFPVRRSVRKTKTTVLEEKQRDLEKALQSNREEGLIVKVFEEKGRGVIADKKFEKGDFVVEYSGELIDVTEAKKRESLYAQDHTTGCYMYYFKHKNQQYCIDATAETGRLGRLVNHSRNGNLITRTVMVDNKPRLVLIARDTIEIGEEVTYDYGDRSKESLKHHPWLAL